MSDAEYKIENPAEQKVVAGPQAAHPGPFIKAEVLAPFKVSVAEAARLMDINRSNFVAVLDGRSDVSRRLAYKLEALTGISADLLIGMQAAHDRWKEQEERASYRQTIKRLTLPEA